MTTITISDPLPAGTYTLVAGTGPIPPIPPDPHPIPPDPQPIPPDAISVPWAEPKTWHLAMLCEATVVFVVNVPADAKPGKYPNQLNFAQHQGLPTIRQAVLSTVAGKFDQGVIEQQQGEQVSLPVMVGQNVQAGGQYFVNVRNWSTDIGGFSCVPGTVMGSIASWIISS